MFLSFIPPIYELFPKLQIDRPISSLTLFFSRSFLSPPLLSSLSPFLSLSLPLSSPSHIISPLLSPLFVPFIYLISLSLVIPHFIFYHDIKTSWPTSHLVPVPCFSQIYLYFLNSLHHMPHDHTTPTITTTSHSHTPSLLFYLSYLSLSYDESP